MQPAWERLTQKAKEKITEPSHRLGSVRRGGFWGPPTQRPGPAGGGKGWAASLTEKPPQDGHAAQLPSVSHSPGPSSQVTETCTFLGLTIVLM